MVIGRKNNRDITEMRPIKIIPDITKYALGSLLLEMGETKVICTISETLEVPQFLLGTNQGWLTAEYNMLPASTVSRKPREGRTKNIDGRSVEIQRFIGRALRAAVDLKKVQTRTLWIDCDVVQADGGTRIASVIGSFLALKIAEKTMLDKQKIPEPFITNFVAGISVGIVDSQYLVDLDYVEDQRAQVDFNIVKLDNNKYVEIQGAGEHGTFSKTDFDSLLSLADNAINKIFEIEKEFLVNYEKK
ncbi:MAG: ribonuclease PH [Planctomycetota bacterium]